MLNNQQIKLVQMAAKGAGLRGGRYSPDSRYYLLLGQYKQSNGKPVTSCKQLTRDQVEDFLSICESMGWQHPMHGPNYYQNKKRWYSNERTSGISTAQAECIRHLAGDLGMTAEHLKTFCLRMTNHLYDSVTVMSAEFAWKMIEALKAMLGRRDGKQYETVADVAAAYGKDD
ncbi:MAG: phage protein GemA/Gp16 family protein [Patescibacteria group bacterium]